MSPGSSLWNRGFCGRWTTYAAKNKYFSVKLKKRTAKKHKIYSLENDTFENEYILRAPKNRWM